MRTALSLGALENSSESSEEESSDEEPSDEEPDAQEPHAATEVYLGGGQKVEEDAGVVQGVKEGSHESVGGETRKENDDEYLDSIISKIKEEGKGLGDGGHTSGSSSLLAELLRCDGRNLKIDYEMRRKFGSSVGNNRSAVQGPGQGRGRGRRRVMPRAVQQVPALTLKKLVVSSPKEDWPKPPSFVVGGMGMERTEAPTGLPGWQLEAHCGAEWFKFKYSPSYQQLQVMYNLSEGIISQASRWHLLRIQTFALFKVAEMEYCHALEGQWRA
ncbi:unnamed protein product [Discosporangium mesarthrocarpum]